MNINRCPCCGSDESVSLDEYVADYLGGVEGLREWVEGTWSLTGDPLENYLYDTLPGRIERGSDHFMEVLEAFCDFLRDEAPLVYQWYNYHWKAIQIGAPWAVSGFQSMFGLQNIMDEEGYIISRPEAVS